MSADAPSPENGPQLVVSPPPHLKAEDDIRSIMQTVCIALMPAFAWAGYNFGWYALLVTAVSVASCIVTEAVCQRLRRKPITICDWSAVVTGLLLAAVLPPNMPLWLTVVGGVFAIGVAKHCFGGLGHNIWNPALLARAFLQNTRATDMMATEWPYLGTGGGLPDIAQNLSTSLAGRFEALQSAAEKFPDIRTGATALAQVQLPETAVADTTMQALLDSQGGYWHLVTQSAIGAEGGCIGEVSAVALLAGGLLLLATKVIKWEIPVCYILTAGLLGWALPAPVVFNGETAYTAWFAGPWALHLVGGGLFIGAFFMATDYVTTPMSGLGRIVFGIGCGILTISIRLYAGYPEGVCYAILLMNLCVPLIDIWTRPVKFGSQPAAS